jgi:hypothetical protein
MVWYSLKALPLPLIPLNPIQSYFKKVQAEAHVIGLLFLNAVIFLYQFLKCYAGEQRLYFTVHVTLWLVNLDLLPASSTDC